VTAKRFFLLFSFLVLASCSAFAEGGDHHIAWKLNSTYSGSHADSFQKLSWIVPNLMRQTMIDMSVRLGMDFQEGWNYPLVVSFVDEAPMGAENALAYVELLGSDTGIQQNLNINLGAYDSYNFNFEKVFAHELVHAMMNDAMGAQAAVLLPVWLHEGLAVYGADQGDTMVRSYASQTNGFEEASLLNGLEGPHGALDYAEDYLAIKYIAVEKGTNALHNFVKEIINRKGDVPGSLQYTCGENWDDFQKNARAFSVEELKNLGPVRRGAIEQPY